MPVTLRKARSEDRPAVFEVEKKATPGLCYLPYVFDAFVSDEQGEFIVAEADDRLVGCGKFTRLPDGSAWLETLRVIPERQGQGIGKQFYRRFLEIARTRRIDTLRMYTGVRNQASKGLAEQFGFAVAGAYRGQKRACLPDQPAAPALPAFEPVVNPALADELLRPCGEAWAGFLVLNRTFYAFSPALAAHLAGQGMLYYHPASQTTLVLGARFMPWQALHIGGLAGDMAAGLAFALHLGRQRGVESLSCYSPAGAAGFQSELAGWNFQAETSEIIVMEARLS